MYCRNCGNQMDNMAVVCVKCGTQKGFGVSYCQNCGNQSLQGAVVCTHCGVPLARPIIGEQKSKIAAGILGIMLGSLGIHNFYLGFTTKAIVQLLLTVLSCGILGIVSGVWGLVEGIMILTGSINADAHGVPLKE